MTQLWIFSSSLDLCFLNIFCIVCGWSGRTRRSRGKPANQLLSKVAGSGFLNSRVPKKFSAQQIADEISRSLSQNPPRPTQSASFARRQRVTSGKKEEPVELSEESVERRKTSHV